MICKDDYFPQKVTGLNIYNGNGTTAIPTTQANRQTTTQQNFVLVFRFISMNFNGKGKKGVKEDGRIQGKDSHFSARSRGMVSIAGQLYLQRCPQLQKNGNENGMGGGEEGGK